MNEIEIETLATPTLAEPVLIEGLPGVGLVGKLVVDHLREALPDRPVRRLYSEHLPPAVGVDNDGTAKLAHLTISAVEAGSTDLLLLSGDSQAQEGVGQYRLAEAVLDIAAEFGVASVVGIGGFGTGERVEDPGVIGAVTSNAESLRDSFEAAGVDIGPDESTSIVGMSGLLVGLGARRSIPAAGILGLTSGYHVDPASARAVLAAIQAVFDFEVDTSTLDEQAEQVQQLLEQHDQSQQQDQAVGGGGENLRYFG